MSQQPRRRIVLIARAIERGEPKPTEARGADTCERCRRPVWVDGMVPYDGVICTDCAAVVVTGEEQIGLTERQAQHLRECGYPEEDIQEALDAGNAEIARRHRSIN